MFRAASRWSRPGVVGLEPDAEGALSWNPIECTVVEIGSAILPAANGKQRLESMGEGRMAFDEGLAQRVRDLLADGPEAVEKRMFGGVAFLLDGNLCCGVHKDDLIVRVGPELHAAALGRPHARPFDITGRPMKGWVLVGAEGCEADEALSAWVQQGVEFARSLPPK
jgi:TfoX-like protein